MNWTEIRLPGVSRLRVPGFGNKLPESPYHFNLVAGPRTIRRAAFESECGFQLSKSDFLCFELRSPTSSAMYPDILRGDFGFPIVSLINSNGTVFHFARGNLKDFFDISRPNEIQTIRLPLGSFLYDVNVKSNPESEGDFFDYPIKNLHFDFLAHPEAAIDIELANIRVEAPGQSARFDTDDLVHFESVARSRLLPVFATESGSMALAVGLTNVGRMLGVADLPMQWELWHENKKTREGSILLKAERSYVSLNLPNIGEYRFYTQITRDGESIASNSRSVIRILPRHRNGTPTILGISDEDQYDHIAYAGGSYERLPVQLQSVVYDPGTGIRFASGRDPLPVHAPGAGRSRMVAAFAMPKWLSSKQDKPDYYRYAPADWDAYGKMIAWLASQANSSGVTHIEVWNEASVIGHWNDSIENLIRLHEVSREAIRRVSSEITVLGGCTHSWTFDFLQSFFEAGGAEHCDGLAIHGYTYQPWLYIEYFDRLDEMMDRFAPVCDRPDFKAHITEIGFRSPAFSEHDQALYLALFSTEAASRDRIASVFWFRFFNPRPESLSFYNQRASSGYAMVGYDQMYCRPMLAAYRFIERVLQEFPEVSAEGPASARRYSFRRDGIVQLIAFFHDGKAETEDELPGGWRRLDHLGGPFVAREGLPSFCFAVAPEAAALLS